MARSSEEWRSWRLKRWWMTTVVLVEAALIIALATLTWWSHTHNGFSVAAYARLTTLSDLSWGKIWASQLSWTLPPALIMTGVGISFNTMVTATAERQPFVELNYQEGRAKNAKITILLDYPSYPAFMSWFVACKNGHSRLGLAMLVHLFNSIVLVALASNLFKANESRCPSDIQLYSSVSFDVSSLNLNKDLQSALDIASAIHAYDAAPPQWMTYTYAIEPFSETKMGSFGNISVQTSVYSAELECKILERPTVNATYRQSIPSDLGEVDINFTGRGCDVINQGFPLSSNISLYALSWHQPCKISPDSRVGVFLGMYSDDDPEKLADFITVSCIPSYQKASALVDMSFSAKGGQQVISISTNETEEMHDNNFESLQASLQHYVVFDASSTYKSDAFGRTVDVLAWKLSGGLPISPEQALNATNTVYTTMFAALATKQLMSPLVTPRQMNGTLTTDCERLYVVVPVAWILLSLLFMTLLASIGLFVQACNSTSILREDPASLLSTAVLLMDSNIFTFIENLRNDNPGEKELGELVRSKYTVKESKCFFDKADHASTGTLCVKGLEAMTLQPPSRTERMKCWFSNLFRHHKNVTAMALEPAILGPIETHVASSNESRTAISTDSSAEVASGTADNHVTIPNRASTMDGCVGQSGQHGIQMNEVFLSRHNTT